MQGQTVSYTPGVNSHTVQHISQKLRNADHSQKAKTRGCSTCCENTNYSEHFFLQTLTSVKLKDSIVQLALACNRNAADAAQQLC